LAGAGILLGIGREMMKRNQQLWQGRSPNCGSWEETQGEDEPSLLDTGGSAIVVSQFTLFADTRREIVLLFRKCATTDIASPLVDLFVEQFRGWGFQHKLVSWRPQAGFT
jgi:D-tyrosyl-tRNA(Tyr) deacylase